MNKQIKASAEIHSGDGGYSVGTQEKYNEFVKNRNRSMNNRIKELAEQAGFTEGGYESDEGPWIGPEFNKEKFAELIVRDVVEQIITQERTDGEWYQTDIFKHFGVEE
jgi:hypothetical protein